MESLSYTGRDNEDIRQSLIDLVPKLTDKWRDFNQSDIGVTMIELIAAAQDMQNFYFDTQTFETYLDTAMQDKNIRSILRAMNYRIPLIVPARSEVTLSYNGSLDDYYSLPKYTRFTCKEVPGVQYLTTDRITLVQGDESSVVTVVEGSLRTLTLTKNEVAKNITVSGNISRRIYLNDINVADKSVTIVQQGQIWEECDDALLKFFGGRYYSIHKDTSGKIYLLMSVDFMDLLPSDADEEFYIQYIVTNGTKGLVDAYQIDTMEEVPDVSPHIYEIYNEEASYGATDEPNLQAAKLLAREHAQTMGRYVTVEDYANGVATDPTILFSVVKDWKTYTLVKRPFAVFVWAVNLQGENLGREEQRSLVNKFNEKGISAVSIEYQNTIFVRFDVDVTIYLRPVTEVEKMSIVGSVGAYIQEVLSYKKIKYGGRLSIGLLISAIYTVSPYIRSVIVNEPTSDVEATEIQLLRLGNVTVNVGKEDEEMRL